MQKDMAGIGVPKSSKTVIFGLDPKIYLLIMQ